MRGGYGFFNEVLLGTEQTQQYASQLPVFHRRVLVQLPPSSFRIRMPGDPVAFCQPGTSTRQQFRVPDTGEHGNALLLTGLYQPIRTTVEPYRGASAIRSFHACAGHLSRVEEGTRLALPVEADPAVYIPGQSTTANTNQRRPYAPAFNSVLVAYPDANSTYNGMVVSFEKRFSQSWSALASYTWSKSIDNTDNVNSANTSSLPDPYNYALNRGPASADQTRAAK